MNLDNNISIFPNPTSAVANVNFSAIDVNELTITLLNVVGQKVWQSETVKVSGSWQKEIDLGAFPAGTYLLKVQADDQTVTKTIVKQ